jgi:hypothetical protein
LPPSWTRTALRARAKPDFMSEPENIFRGVLDWRGTRV